MVRTPSQRANDLFAAYVAIEEAQYRLEAEDQIEAANALSDAAIAARDRLMAEPDHSGNADMIAGRVLAHFMMMYPWPPHAATDWNDEDRAISLPVLTATAGRTTGKVRHYARVALAALNVEIPDEASDAMLDLCERERRYQAAYKVADFDGQEEEKAWQAANDAEAGRRLCADPPPIATEAGLRAAIRYVVEDEGFVQKSHARILTRVLEYLDGRAAA